MKPTTPNTFGAELRAERERIGLSQINAARLFDDLLNRDISAWETGIRTPPPYTQKLILDKLRGIPSPYAA